MASVKAIFSAGAILVGTVGGVHAADLLPPPVEPVAAPSFGNWYIRGDVGVGIDQISGLRSTFGDGTYPPGFAHESSSLNNQVELGLGAGYQFNNWFRADVTGEYRTDSHYSGLESYSTVGCGGAGVNTCYDGYSANVNSAVFLANGYFDIGTWYGVTPFFGAGVGFSHNTIAGLTDTGQGYGMAPDHSKFDFAWALMAGLSYSVTPNLKLEMSYRYLNMGSAQSGGIQCFNTQYCTPEYQNFKLASNDIRIGFRYMFADYIPPAPPLEQPPLVRKY
jgi:opacity protein-like surface antigen